MGKPPKPPPSRPPRPPPPPLGLSGPATAIHGLRNSWTRECNLSELTTTYAGWHPDLVRPYSARWYKWALYDRDPVEQWSKGRVTLLGDSAHAMLPYLGQGAAMAIEDACVLSTAIVRHADDLDEALLAYERVRLPRTRAAVLGSRDRARENHLASPWARLKRDVKFALRERFGRDNTVFSDSVTLWLRCQSRAAMIGKGLCSSIAAVVLIASDCSGRVPSSVSCP